MQQRGQRGAAKLKSGAPASRHVAEADRQQQEDRDRSEDDGEHREGDGFTRDGAAHDQDLLYRRGSEPALQVALHAGHLCRGQRRVANDVAAAASLYHRPVDVLGVDRALHLREGGIVGDVDRQLGTSSEVDAEREVSRRHGNDAGDDDDQRKGKEQVAPADDVEAADPRRGRRGRDSLGRLGLRGSVRNDVGALLLRLDVRQLGHGPPRASPGAGNRCPQARSRGGCGSRRWMRRGLRKHRSRV